MSRIPCDQTAAWRALQAHFDGGAHALDLRDAFAADAQRVQAFSQEAPYLFADLSKNRIDVITEALLFDLARERGVERYRDAMFAGDRINGSEDRAALHCLLREPPLAVRRSADPLGAQRAQVQSTLQAMLAFAERIRSDAAITDVVNIGIGGSDLGPQMAVQALSEHVTADKRFHFVSNIDGHELAAVLAQIDAPKTLFLIASKTFTTVETMTNARSALRWFEAQGGRDVAQHFVALTQNMQAAHEFGIDTVFSVEEWVGGRYSLWSAVGLPVAIAIGADGFRGLLEGAHAMDLHFRTADLRRNLPIRLGLLDVWNRNFQGFASRSIAPYHSALRRLPAYLQQLEMESNGKRVDADGRKLRHDTAPVIWGEPGTNGQHAYFQMLHQGSDVIPVEFIVVRRRSHGLDGHHEVLLANALAQAHALMTGKADAHGHRDFPGNRPSTFFVLDSLTPQSLGALLALHEHRVFVSGAVWGINSFDQWGVELGKVLASNIGERMRTGDLSGLDPSTAGLMRRLK
ncbi:MAG: glucose-6-phosphate isomerase [Burkholderiaceae bacterium]|nr:glucose-6-phosphate isomerase [Burkholderiaceae bacterium]